MVKENKATENTKEKKCNCGPDCKCGCQEGKECTCGNKECCCSSKNCNCGCPCKRVLGKVLLLALVFFAGMGVNQFMSGCCLGGCPIKKGMRPMPMLQSQQIPGNLPFYKDGKGNTIIIVNTGADDTMQGCKCGCRKHGKHHKMVNMPSPQKHTLSNQNPEQPTANN